MASQNEDWRQIQERLALIGDDDDDDDEEAGIVASDDRDEESFATVTKKESSALSASSTALQAAPPAKWTNMRHTPSQRRACMRISALVLCLLFVVAALVSSMWPKHHAPPAPLQHATRQP